MTLPLVPGPDHPLKVRLMALGRELFEGFDLLQPWEKARHEGNIQDVINGVGIPTMSAVERARFEEAVKRIPEEP